MSVCQYPCPCGYYGDPEREVQANCVRRLAGHGAAPLREKRISRPLMDRQPAALCGPISASRRPKAPRQRALRALEKLTSDRPVPQAARRADPNARAPKAPSAVGVCGTWPCGGSATTGPRWRAAGPRRGQRRCGPGRGARTLPGGQCRQVAAARGDATPPRWARQMSARPYGDCRQSRASSSWHCDCGSFTWFRTGLAESQRIEAPHVAEAIQCRHRRML